MSTILTTQGIEDVYDDFGPVLFVRAHEASTHPHLLKRDLRHAVPREVLPERARSRTIIETEHCVDVLADVDDAIVLLRSWKASADVWVSAPSGPVARRIADEVAARVPPREFGRRVETQFCGNQTATRYLDVDTRPWDEVRGLYPDQVRDALDLLVGHRHEVDESRRLLLWHGDPGTGKTTAIRALMHAWQEWAVPVVVSDPEVLLVDDKYMRRVLLDADDERWQLVVLEDAESLLHKGSGKGLAKLLNLCDGLLGQGLRSLFLITTNEPLGAVHPALVRPGRCLARVEFGSIPPAQASLLLGRAVEHAMTVAELMTAGPISVRREVTGVGQYL